MRGSEIDIVQGKAKEAARLYRTWRNRRRPLDRIVHGETDEDR